MRLSDVCLCELCGVAGLNRKAVSNFGCLIRKIQIIMFLNYIAFVYFCVAIHTHIHTYQLFPVTVGVYISVSYFCNWFAEILAFSENCKTERKDFLLQANH